MIHLLISNTDEPHDQTLFAFNQSYIDDSARDTLSLSFKDRFGGLLTTLRPAQTRVAPFFANLLPEAELRAERATVSFRAGGRPA